MTGAKVGSFFEVCKFLGDFFVKNFVGAAECGDCEGNFVILQSMTVTIDFLRSAFADFNLRIFGGRLPEPAFAISDSKGALGQYVRRRDGADEIRVTGRFEMSREQLEDVLIHEMIHYFIRWSGLVDTAPHGTIFRGMMVAVNRVHGRAIGVSARLTDRQRAEATAKSGRTRVIAVLRLANGSVGVKVIPRNSRSVAEFRRKLSSAANLESVRFYVHDNPYFSRFPRSVSLRCHILPEAELKEALRGAEPLEI